jgi:hypothetical protein
MDTPMTTQLSKLRKLDLAELQAEYERVFEKPSKSRNRDWLFKVIAKKIQDNEEPESAKRPVELGVLVAKFERKKTTRSRNVTAKSAKKAKGEKKTKVKAIGERDKRLPKPGTTISREWHGKKYMVKCLDQGFEYGGKPYRSLSGVAKQISGQIVNGFLWWGLIPTEDKKS